NQRAGSILPREDQATRRRRSFRGRAGVDDQQISPRSADGGIQRILATACARFGTDGGLSGRLATVSGSDPPGAGATANRRGIGLAPTVSNLTTDGTDNTDN